MSILNVYVKKESISIQDDLDFEMDTFPLIYTTFKLLK